ncbi:hypothetical protein [Pseudooceanicola sp.]|uniref:hypothetical protein n=1 Tax=Pseudooceanicola sp. TaxID=1914328 RepID=UPI0035118C6E
MTLIDENPQDRLRSGLGGLLLRLLVRLVYTFCLCLMAAVLLSEPRIAARVGPVIDGWAERLSSDVPAAPDAAEATPVVRTMPADRVPVRRLID